jgi:MFS family permease
VANTRAPSTVTAVRPRWVLGLTSIAYFMVVLDSLVVVTALPRMQQDLRTGLAALQWTVNAYGIAFAAGIITAAAVLNAVPAAQLGKASGISYMAQRFGTVFAIAIGSAVFSANGHLGNPAAVTAGFRPALWCSVVFAALAAATALAIPAPAHRTTTSQETARTDPADGVVAA